MRTLNLPLLREWLINQGPLAKEDLASRARIKFYSLDRVVRGEREFTELERKAVCEATGLSMDDLFPIADQSTKEIA